MSSNWSATAAGVLTAAFAIVLGVAVRDAPAAAAGAWDHTVAVQHGPEGHISFELWTRGDGAVLVASVDGQAIHEARCEDGRLVSWSAGSVSLVTREGLSAERCFEWATDPLLGYARAPEKIAMQRTAEAAGTVTFDSATGPIRRLVRTAAGLPLSAVLASGGTMRWEYPETPAEPDWPPPLDESGVLERETYRDLAPAAAAGHLGLDSIPDQIAGLPLETVFSYDASTAAGAAYYAVWRADDGREIQLAVTPARAPDDALGHLDAGTLSLQEGPNHVRIVAPDRALLRAAVEALRPAAAGQLGSP